MESAGRGSSNERSKYEFGTDTVSSKKETERASSSKDPPAWVDDSAPAWDRGAKGPKNVSTSLKVGFGL